LGGAAEKFVGGDLTEVHGWRVLEAGADVVLDDPDGVFGLTAEFGQFIQ
jgi:hypothetical protein